MFTEGGRFACRSGIDWEDGMIARRDHGLHLGLAAVLLAGLAGCTSSMEDAAKQELKANPVAGTSAEQVQTAAATAAASTLPAPVDPNAAAVPAPIIPGTQTPAPIPTFKAVALLASPGATPSAVAMAAGQENVAIQTAAMPSSTTAVTTLPMSTDTADPAVLPPEVTAQQTIVPVTKPAGAALAYASPSATTSLAALDSQFDTTPPGPPPSLAQEPASSGPTVINALIKKYAALYQMPEELIHRVVKRESTYKPTAYNNGHYGLMQIKYSTAKSMGYTGPASGLFDAETNLKYAIKYLKGAWLVAEKSHDGAVSHYSRGFYYDAKRKGMLHVLQPDFM